MSPLTSEQPQSKIQWEALVTVQFRLPSLGTVPSNSRMSSPLGTVFLSPCQLLRDPPARSPVLGEALSYANRLSCLRKKISFPSSL